MPACGWPASCWQASWQQGRRNTSTAAGWDRHQRYRQAERGNATRVFVGMAFVEEARATPR